MPQLTFPITADGLGVDVRAHLAGATLHPLPYGQPFATLVVIWSATGGSITAVRTPGRRTCAATERKSPRRRRCPTPPCPKLSAGSVSSLFGDRLVEVQDQPGHGRVRGQLAGVERSVARVFADAYQSQRLPRAVPVPGEVVREAVEQD